MNDKQNNLPLGQPPDTAIVKVENGQPSAMQLMEMAIEKYGTSGAKEVVDIIERLTVLKRDDEARIAKQNFFDRLRDFQQQCPPITKNAMAHHSKYASLDHIVRTISKLLTSLGFSYYWDAVTSESEITVTCYLNNCGHAISVSATAPIPKSMPGQNEVQIPSSVRTYLKRNTFVQILGLVAVDEDTDGINPGELLSEEQAKELTAFMQSSIPPGDQANLLAFLKIKTIDELPVKRLSEVKDLIAAKKKQREKAEAKANANH